MEEKDLRNLVLDHQRNFPEAVAAGRCRRTRSHRDPPDSHCNSPRIRGPPSQTAQRWAPSGWRAISVTKSRKEWRAKWWRGSQEACYPEGCSLVTRKKPWNPHSFWTVFFSFNWAWKEAETKLLSKSVKRLRKRHLLTGTYRCRMRIGSRSTSRPLASSTGTP